MSIFKKLILMDYPYILNYFILLILAYLYWKKPDPKLVNWAFFLEFVFIAFRAPVVGADTWDYVRYLDGERNFYNYDPRPLETGFVIYRQVLLTLHPNRFVVMLVNSFLSCYPLYIIIKRYSNNVPLTLAMLSIFNFYVVYFCGLRQILGFAILLMGLIYVLDEKKKKWLVFVLCAALGYSFHTTIVVYAAIFLAAYFLRFKSRTILISSVVISAVFGIVLQSFNIMDAFNFFLSMNVEATERIENYMQGNSDVDEITSIFINLRPTIIAVLIYALMDKEKLNHWFSVIYALGIIIGNLFISVPMIGRLTGCFTIFGVVAFSWILGKDYLASFKKRKVTNLALVFFLLYFSQMLVKSNIDSAIDLISSARMHPYQFIWEDYSNHPSIKYFK